MIHYILKGNPTPLHRSRISGKRMYDDQAELKTISRIELTRQHNNRPLFKGPLSLTAVFYMQTPKKNAIKYYGSYHSIRPDADNLLKLICDISTGVLYNDDCCIAEIRCKKIYDANPRTEFYFEELGNG